jgi:hypothetical protein
MDIVYLTAAVALWVAVLGLALGCERLQPSKVTP